MGVRSDFFEEIFFSSFEKLTVVSEEARSVLGGAFIELLKEEGVNHQVIKQCCGLLAEESEYKRRRWLIDGVSGLSVALLQALKPLHSNIGVFSSSHPANTFMGAPVVREVGNNDVLVNDLFRDARLDRHYVSLLAQHRRTLQAALQLATGHDGSVIVFAAKKVYFNQLRLSKVLRDCGYKTVALVFDHNMVKHQAGFFDDIIYTDFISFLMLLNSVDRKLLLHTQGWLFRYHIPVLIDTYKPKHCRQIIEIMDSQSFYLPEATVSKIPDTMKMAWGENVIENHQLQLACENYIVHHADGVIFNGDDEYRQPLVKRDSQHLRNKHLAFPALPVKDFFHASNIVNKEKKLVFVGGVPPFSANRPHELFGDSQLLGLVMKLIARGCYLDIYNNPLIAAEEDYAKLYPDFIELTKRHRNFNFFIGDMPQHINKKIAHYDFGLMVYDFGGIYTGDLHFKHLIPTKLFNYLEAGLPVLVSDRFSAVCSIVKEYRIGVVINQREIEFLPEIIEMLDVAELKKNVVAAREELQMHNNIHRLTGFYEQVMA